MRARAQSAHYNKRPDCCARASPSILRRAVRPPCIACDAGVGDEISARRFVAVVRPTGHARFAVFGRALNSVHCARFGLAPVCARAGSFAFWLNRERQRTHTHTLCEISIISARPVSLLVLLAACLPACRPLGFGRISLSFSRARAAVRAKRRRRADCPVATAATASSALCSRTSARALPTSGRPSSRATWPKVRARASNLRCGRHRRRRIPQSKRPTSRAAAHANTQQRQQQQQATQRARVSSSLGRSVLALDSQQRSSTNATNKTRTTTEIEATHASVSLLLERLRASYDDDGEANEAAASRRQRQRINNNTHARPRTARPSGACVFARARA